jgi:hypothetical protein
MGDDAQVTPTWDPTEDDLAIDRARRPDFSPLAVCSVAFFVVVSVGLAVAKAIVG